MLTQHAELELLLAGLHLPIELVGKHRLGLDVHPLGDVGRRLLHGSNWRPAEDVGTKPPTVRRGRAVQKAVQAVQTQHTMHCAVRGGLAAEDTRRVGRGLDKPGWRLLNPRQIAW